MIVALQLPRFELTVAAGRDAQLQAPLALAPEPGREPVVGEASAAAEAFGVRGGMRLGEALARCPQLRLVPPDPAGVADAHDALLTALEAIGAAVESGRPGLAFFDAHALRHVHGGLDGVVGAARRAAARPARVGAAPTRFAALAAAARARARRTEVFGDLASSAVGGGSAGHGGTADRGGAAGRDGGAGGRRADGPDGVDGRRGRRRSTDGGAALRRALAPLPVVLLADLAAGREEDAVLATLVEPLERLGIRTLGDLAQLPRAAVSDRFGVPGLRAFDLARGRDTPLRPREPVERLEETLELPEAASGPQLEQGLALLVDRLLARRERRGRALRSAVLSARLVEGGTWRERQVFREPLADARRMRLVLAPKLAGLPAPAERLTLRAEGFGPPAGAQGALLTEPATARAQRLREAIRQARAAAGPEAALRVLAVDPDSRVPERRLVLAPWEA